VTDAAGGRPTVGAPREPSVPAPPPPGTRRRLLGVLFAGAGVTRTGFIAAISVTALVAQDALGSPALAGVPGALAVVGMAAATPAMSAYMGRAGRRRGMILGQVVAIVGAAGAVLATARGWFLPLVAALFVLGAGNSADRLGRYAAADITSPLHRGAAIAFVVWAGTVGSVLGPALLEPAGRLGEVLGVGALAGPYVLAGVAFLLAGLLVGALLRPDPLRFAPEERPRPGARKVPLRALVSAAPVRAALVGLVAGQVVMVLVMTMTPVHMRDAGEGLGAIGLVISAHTLGMFALSPVTGILSDRLGRLPVVVAGLLMLLVASLVAVPTGGTDRWVLVGALFLLGLGWNFAFVAGSALVVEGVPAERRLRLQGVADATVWTSGATASVLSGLLLAGGGYATVSLAGAFLAAAALFGVAVWRRRRGSALSAPRRRSEPPGRRAR